MYHKKSAGKRVAKTIKRSSVIRALYQKVMSVSREPVVQTPTHGVGSPSQPGAAAKSKGGKDSPVVRTYPSRSPVRDLAVLAYHHRELTILADMEAEVLR
jgi:hypothetical protein